LQAEFKSIFNERPWVLGQIPIMTMTYLEHVLKNITEYTMKIVMEEIKEIDENCYKELQKNYDHLNEN